MKLLLGKAGDDLFHRQILSIGIARTGVRRRKDGNGTMRGASHRGWKHSLNAFSLFVGRVAKTLAGIAAYSIQHSANHRFSRWKMSKQAGSAISCNFPQMTKPG